MRIITKRRLVDFWERHPNAQRGLELWHKLVSKAEWQNFVELRAVFPAADQVGKFTVFNIGGNKFRLIVLVDYDRQKVFIRHVLTHADYDKDTWKQDDWYD